MVTASKDIQQWRTYTPSGVKDSGTAIERLARDLKRARSVAWRLLVRDLNAQYRQSLLGYVWVFVPPLIVVLTFVLAGRAEILNTQTASIPYPVFALIGVILWQSFSEAINGPIAGVKASKKMMGKISVPPEAIVLAKLGHTVFNLAIRLVLVTVVIAWYGIGIHWSMPAAIPALFVLLIFGTALGLFLAPLGGLYDDVGLVLGITMSLWFFLTPIMYEQAAAGSIIEVINTFNPVTSLVTTPRELLIGATISRPIAFFIVTCISFTLFGIGWMVYRVSLSYVIERTSA